MLPTLCLITMELMATAIPPVPPLALRQRENEERISYNVDLCEDKVGKKYQNVVPNDILSDTRLKQDRISWLNLMYYYQLATWQFCISICEPSVCCGQD